MGRGRIIQLNVPFNAENYRRVVRGYRPCVKMDINEEEKHRKLSLDPNSDQFDIREEEHFVEAKVTRQKRQEK